MGKVLEEETKKASVENKNRTFFTADSQNNHIDVSVTHSPCIIAQAHV